MPENEDTVLLPCPFCGGDASFGECHKAQPGTYFVNCVDCLASTNQLLPCVGLPMEEAAELWNRRAAAPTSAREVAERFHDLYEALAPRFGYETREETRVFDSDSANGRLMIEVCRRLAPPAAQAGQRAEAIVCDHNAGCETPNECGLHGYCRRWIHQEQAIATPAADVEVAEIDYRKHAESLNAGALSLIEQVLIKHSAALLEEMHDQLRAREQSLSAQVEALKSDNAALVRERDNLQRLHNEAEEDSAKFQGKLIDAEKERDRLRAELDAAKVDAERYRWLRVSHHQGANSPTTEGIMVVTDRPAKVPRYIGPLGWQLLDAAIDAARVAVGKVI